MPDLTIETVIACPHWASNWDVEGSNGNSYLVQFHRGEPASCSCPAYKYSGEYGEQNCKHIDKVRKHGCFYHPQTGDNGLNDWDITWNQPENYDADNEPIKLPHGVRLLSTAADTTKERCIGCGAPGLAMRIAV